MDDIDEMMEKHMGLVIKQLEPFFLVNDLAARSAAMEGLFNAIKSYNPSHEREASFGTYASVCIYNAIAGYLRKVKRENEANLLIVSYHAPVNETDDFLSILASNQNIEEDYLRKEQLVVIKELIATYISSNKGKAVLLATAWIDSGCTLNSTDLAKIVDVSQSYASQKLKEFQAFIKRGVDKEWNK